MASFKRSLYLLSLVCLGVLGASSLSVEPALSEGVALRIHVSYETALSDTTYLEGEGSFLVLEEGG